MLKKITVILLGVILLSSTLNSFNNFAFAAPENIVLVGDGPPLPKLGQVGDMYIDSLNSAIGVYKKISKDVWEQVSLPLGPPGPIGFNGTDGLPGPQGPAGADGTNGIDGISVTSATIVNGELILSLSNGVDVNLGNIIGPQGEQGIQGETGPQGPIGFNGTDGLPGPQGPAGADGISVTIATIVNGELILSLSNGVDVNLGNIIGPAGADGLPGPQGEKGDKGDPGDGGFSIGDHDVVLASTDQFLIVHETNDLKFGGASIIPLVGDTGIQGITMYDVNQDGILDVLAADYAQNSIHQFYATGTGSLGLPIDIPSIAYAGSGGLSKVVTADFDGNGIVDLAANEQTSDRLTVLLGTGPGKFGTATDYTIGSSNPSSLAIGDFNGDDNQDVAVSSNSANKVWILLGNGDGTLGSSTDFATGSGSLNVAVGKLNDDNYDDLVVINPGSDNISILLATGSGGFGPATNIPIGSFANSLLVDDFNNDNYDDIVAYGGGVGAFSILIANGIDGFNAPTNLASTIADISDIVAVDMNNDSNLDLVAATGTGFSIFLGGGDGNFEPESNFKVANESLFRTILVGKFH